ncbi:peptidoglycan-binding protein [Streptomyces mirabilis]|uniref:peptidoglycan-binding domain-containing protein n=1 Tax=Streptomyces mirabilis TaxID=68239 RepID=UPI0036A155A4
MLPVTEYHARVCPSGVLEDVGEGLLDDAVGAQLDGVFGTKSQAAAADFQRLANKYYGVTLTVDGKVGPKTWPVLRAHAF